MQLKYNSVEELVAAASSSNKKISEIVLEQQAEDMETSPEDVYSTMESSFEVMRQSVLNGMDESLRSSSGLSGGAAAKLKKGGRGRKKTITAIFLAMPLAWLLP